MNRILIHDFVCPQEKQKILDWITSQGPGKEIENPHIKAVNDRIDGFSILCDMTKTEVSTFISKFQGDNTGVAEIPEIFYTIKDRIAETLKINKDHVFFQAISIGPEGMVAGHYDAGMPGYVTYKCNVNIVCEGTDVVHIDKEKLEIAEGDLYCFEASLYKHWVNKSGNRRVLLSYGFLLPYADLGWTEDSPRIRLQNRIWKAFIRQVEDPVPTSPD